jgi:hypothetical protein
MRSGILFSALLSALILSGAASAPAWADLAPSAEAAQPLAVGVSGEDLWRAASDLK